MGPHPAVAAGAGRASGGAWPTWHRATWCWPPARGAPTRWRWPPRWPTRRRGSACAAGGVTVDHGLQAGSAERAGRVAALLGELGLDPVHQASVTVPAGPGSGGPEAAARTARYTALEQVAEQAGAAAVLLGHSRDDQAETVLLGLARGAGGRALAGMPAAARPVPAATARRGPGHAARGMHRAGPGAVGRSAQHRPGLCPGPGPAPGDARPGRRRSAPAWPPRWPAAPPS